MLLLLQAAGVQETGGDLAQQMTELPAAFLTKYVYAYGLPGKTMDSGILTFHLGKTGKLFLFPLEEHAFLLL